MCFLIETPTQYLYFLVRAFTAKFLFLLLLKTRTKMFYEIITEPTKRFKAGSAFISLYEQPPKAS